MNSRNWVLSLAMSHTFIQFMLTTDQDPANFRQHDLEDLFAVAVKGEIQMVNSDPDFNDAIDKTLWPPGLRGGHNPLKGTD